MRARRARGRCGGRPAKIAGRYLAPYLSGQVMSPPTAPRSVPIELEIDPQLAAVRVPPVGALMTPETHFHTDETAGGVIVHAMEEQGSGSSPITIVIADDHQVVRAGLRLLLEAEEEFEVVAEAGDVPTTERRLSAYRPRVLILDLNMPGESSLPAIPRMREGSPETQIVVLTMQNDPAFAREALRAGAPVTCSRRRRTRSSSKPCAWQPKGART